MNPLPAHADAPPSGAVPPNDSEGGGSERERLLATWRLHPEALVDLSSPEIEGGPDDGAGLVRMTDVQGNDIDEFHFANAAAADEAVDYALRQIRPNAFP